MYFYVIIQLSKSYPNRAPPHEFWNSNKKDSHSEKMTMQKPANEANKLLRSRDACIT